MVFFKKDKNKLCLDLKIKPNSAFTIITGFDDDLLYINVSQLPINNKANEELIKYFRKIFKVEKSEIKIIKGHFISKKTLEICTQRADELLDIIFNILKVNRLDINK